MCQNKTSSSNTGSFSADSQINSHTTSGYSLFISAHLFLSRDSLVWSFDHRHLQSELKCHLAEVSQNMFDNLQKWCNNIVCSVTSNISFSRIACYITFSSQMTICHVFCLFNRQIQSLAGYSICISKHLSRQLFPLPLRCTSFFFPVLHMYFQGLLSYIMFATRRVPDPHLHTKNPPRSAEGKAPALFYCHVWYF